MVVYKYNQRTLTMNPLKKIFLSLGLVITIIYLGYDIYGTWWTMQNEPEWLGLRILTAEVFPSVATNDFVPVACVDMIMKAILILILAMVTAIMLRTKRLV